MSMETVLLKKLVKLLYLNRKKWKIELTPEQYQLRISQKPMNIAEAFAYRKESIFPQGILQKQSLEKLKTKSIAMNI